MKAAKSQPREKSAGQVNIQQVHYNDIIGMHYWYSKPVFTVIL